MGELLQFRRVRKNRQVVKSPAVVTPPSKVSFYLTVLFITGVLIWALTK